MAVLGARRDLLPPAGAAAGVVSAAIPAAA
jgi:hypothetical protein